MPLDIKYNIQLYTPGDIAPILMVLYCFNTVRPGSGYMTPLSREEGDVPKNQNSMETEENLAALEPEEDYQVPSYEVPEGESIIHWSTKCTTKWNQV